MANEIGAPTAPKKTIYDKYRQRGSGEYAMPESPMKWMSAEQHSYDIKEPEPEQTGFRPVEAVQRIGEAGSWFVTGGPLVNLLSGFAEVGQVTDIARKKEFSDKNMPASIENMNTIFPGAEAWTDWRDMPQDTLSDIAVPFGFDESGNRVTRKITIAEADQWRKEFERSYLPHFGDTLGIVASGMAHMLNPVESGGKIISGDWNEKIEGAIDMAFFGLAAAGARVGLKKVKAEAKRTGLFFPTEKGLERALSPDIRPGKTGIDFGDTAFSKRSGGMMGDDLANIRPREAGTTPMMKPGTEFGGARQAAQRSPSTDPRLKEAQGGILGEQGRFAETGEALRTAQGVSKQRPTKQLQDPKDIKRIFFAAADKIIPEGQLGVRAKDGSLLLRFEDGIGIIPPSVAKAQGWVPGGKATTGAEARAQTLRQRAAETGMPEYGALAETAGRESAAESAQFMESMTGGKAPVSQPATRELVLLEGGGLAAVDGPPLRSGATLQPGAPPVEAAAPLPAIEAEGVSRIKAAKTKAKTVATTEAVETIKKTTEKKPEKPTVSKDRLAVLKEKTAQAKKRSEARKKKPAKKSRRSPRKK